MADLDTEFGDLPPVICHVGEFNQVFLNIIVNAAHAVGDHRVFDPFFTTNEVGRGTGHGLAIARSVIVEKHEG